jgi:hypothetical protein
LKTLCTQYVPDLAAPLERPRISQHDLPGIIGFLPYVGVGFVGAGVGGAGVGAYQPRKKKRLDYGSFTFSATPARRGS